MLTVYITEKVVPLVEDQDPAVYMEQVSYTTDLCSELYPENVIKLQQDNISHIKQLVA